MAVSAAGRGAERVPYNYYPTPAWCVHRLLDDCGRELFGSVRHALEPTVGDGAIVRACESWGLDEVRWTGVELRRDALDPRTNLHRHFEGLDYRGWAGPPGFGLGMGNPPFQIAESIVRRCLAQCRRTAMLLRVGIAGSAERVPFWRTVAADPFVRVLPDRPSFDGEGTDSATYAWFIWGAELKGPRFDVLDATPVRVRSAQAAEARAFEADLRQVPLFGEAS